ncbi:MAG: fatty acid desaturase [Hyphomicrobiaceae bacterium]
MSHPTPRDLKAILSGYQTQDTLRSIFELAVTFVPLVVLWLTAWAALSVSVWLALLIAVPAAVFLVRLFLIQHDCGHGSFFRSRAANDWMGRVLGVFTMTPYDVWRHSHAVHHATTGNLDHRGTGDISTLTVREYLALPWWRRFAYRIYRHPIIMFVIGPGYVFLLRHRLPLGAQWSSLKPWVSAMGTNLGIAALVALIIWAFGLKAFLLVHLPIVLLSASIGVWLFYVQHQFEDTYWEHSGTWSFHDAALEGSTHYDLPVVLRWLTANIGIHHVHHLSSRIPFYHLNDVIMDHPELADVKRVTLLESLKTVKLKLWDEDRQRLISFREIGRPDPATA